jgi:hypothetical protein
VNKTLVVFRNERSTYEVHGEQEQSPHKFVGGLSLDLPRLKTELLQHGCTEELAAKALQEVENGGSTTIYI